MPSFYVETRSGEKYKFDINKPEIAIGRDLKNDLRLDDPRVSRAHATVRRNEFGLILRDLESGNGTFLNGARINGLRDYPLSPGDKIKLGSCKLIFQLQDPQKTKPETNISRETQKFREVLQRTADDVIKQSSLVRLAITKNASPSLYRHELEKKERMLSLFYEMSRKLGSIFSLNEIYDKVFEILFEITPASRCFIFRKNDQPGGSGFEKVAQAVRGEGEAGEPLPISKTIFAKVAGERSSFLYDSTLPSATSAPSRSIVDSGVKSVMAAPILGPRGLLGIVYVDRIGMPAGFGDDDLDTLNAVAVHTGIAINTAMTLERLQKQAKARASFERFLPRPVVEQIFRSPESIKLGGEKKLITVLFADLRNFTSLSETREPDSIVNLLNDYFSMVSEIIFKHGGTLDKYIGDGLMAIFGAPYAGELDAVEAVNAAIDIQRSLTTFNLRLAERDIPPISVGIGINTGYAIVGYIGSESRLDYTAIGDTVNTASRLESLALPNQILISEYTMQAIDDSFDIQLMDFDKGLKGKTDKLKVAEIKF